MSKRTKRLKRQRDEARDWHDHMVDERLERQAAREAEEQA